MLVTCQYVTFVAVRPYDRLCVDTLTLIYGLQCAYSWPITEDEDEIIFIRCMLPCVGLTNMYICGMHSLSIDYVTTA